ncbi:hypothetical protein QEH54_15475 [Pelagicoccus sp. SDUM812003]|nr:hypothetical protein [Pelagicoccus sp. SDUM812003]
MCARGVRANLIPGVALQAIGLVVVGAYYFVPATSGFFEFVRDVKLEYGYWYSAVTTAVFGGLIPFLYIYATGRVKKGSALAIGAFFVFAWMEKGIEVDFLYRFQAVLFGDAANAATVAKKVAFDQFVYCPLWSAPVTAILYRWKDCDFSWARFKRSFDRELFTLHIPSVLVSTWMVWIPGTAFVYSMPSDLQLPLFTLVLCFFVLLVSALEKDEPQIEVGRNA